MLCDDKRTVFICWIIFLGGPGMNSRLNVAYERRGLVYNVDQSNELTWLYTDTGAFSIYTFGTDRGWILSVALTYELKRMRDVKMTSQIEAAKNSW